MTETQEIIAATGFETVQPVKAVERGYNHTRNFFVVLILIEVLALIIASLV